VFKRLSILIGVLFSVSAYGQIVNIENQRLRNPKDGWSGNLDLTFNTTKNTRMIYQIGNRNRVYWKKQQHLVTFLTDFLYVNAGNQNFVNHGFQHGRYSYNSKQFKKIYLEGFEQFQYNQIQLINLRTLVGGGARAIVVDKDSASISLGAFVMGEYEESRSNVNRHIRYSTFFSFDFQFNKTTGINSITYYQPDFIAPDDYRVSTEMSLRFNITQKLRFRLVYTLQHDSRPPDGAPETMYFISNVFSFGF
jgi:putative salt-induced outer membrane protein YdiY